MNNVAFPQCCSCTLLFIQRVAGRPFVWLTSCVMEAEHVNVSSTWARACTVSQVCNPAASQPCALHGGAQSVFQFVLDVLCCWTSASMKLTARVCSLLVLANVNACISADMLYDVTCIIPVCGAALIHVAVICLEVFWKSRYGSTAVWSPSTWMMLWRNFRTSSMKTSHTHTGET